MNSIFINLTGNKGRHKIFDGLDLTSQSLWSYMPLSGERKWCLQLFSVTFDQIFVKLAGNKDRHKSLNEFQFGPDHLLNSLTSYDPSRCFAKMGPSSLSENCNNIGQR